MRKLASIQIVEEKHDIPEALNIEAIRILGWWVIAKKNDFKVGDRCVYFEIDSFLPERPEFEFLRKSSFKHHPLGVTGFRLKTIKMRGQISQGLALPLNEFKAMENINVVGTDLTDQLEIIKWEDELEPSCRNIQYISHKNFPYFIPKTDETRIQSCREELTKLSGKPYYITVKLDGSSMTVYQKDEVYGVCSRNIELEDENNIYSITADKYDLKNKLKGKNLAIQGELCGPSNGNPKNPLKLMEHDFFVFNVFDIDKQQFFSYEEMIALCQEFGLKTVPLFEQGDCFEYDVTDLLQMAIGKYESGTEREGIVIRSKCKTISFKAISNQYLLRQK
jgi:RNA ligase (TIGR02306 family)